MTIEDAKGICADIARKHKLFRLIEIRLHDRGASVVFADMPDTDMRTICNWFERAGSYPLYVGREYRFDGYVMLAELR